MNSNNNELRIFVSSTFRDMQEEREYLVKKIFPEIRALCRERGVTFTEVDLRWGLTEEDQSLGRIIRTCLEEIDRCRPYFIGITGNRYGYVPELAEIHKDSELLARHPWIEDAALDGASILELEFIHGVFNNDADGAYFYCRIGAQTEADDPERLESLVERMRNSGRPYHEFSSSAQLGDHIRKDLLELIDREWPPSALPSIIDTERRAHQAFAINRRRAYIPNTEYLKRFNAWVKSDEPPLLVAADSGMGKSALIAWLVDNYRRRSPNAFIIEHYVGATSQSGDHVGLMRRVIEEIRERYAIDEAPPESIDELERVFPSWLARVGAIDGHEDDRLLIALDAVDQLHGASRSLAWLPEAFPRSVRLMVSSRPEETLDRLQARGWQELRLRPLEQSEREALVVRYLGEFHKGLPPSLLRRIASDEKASFPLFLRTIAEELRLHGEHESLNDAVERYLRAADLDDLFQCVLERMEEDYGAGIVRNVLASIAASRAGLTENELIGINVLSRADLSVFLHALDYHLLRGEGRLNFFHNYLRRGVEKRYFSDEGSNVEMHRRIAEYLGAQLFGSDRSFVGVTDRLLMREYLYQLAHAQAWDELREQLASLPVLTELFGGETEYEFLLYWRLVIDKSDVSKLYDEAIERSQEVRVSPLARFDVELRLGRLFRALGDWMCAEERGRRAVELAESIDDGERRLAAYSALGDLLMLRGKHEEAIAEFRRQFELAEQMGNPHAAVIASGSIGAIHLERGEYDRAMERYQEMLRICRERGDRRGLAQATGKIGQIHLNRGEYDDALVRLSESLDVFESLGELRETARALGQIGLAYWNQGEFTKAMELYHREMAINEELGDRHGMAMVAGQIGLVYFHEGDFDNALVCFDRYLELTTQLGYAKGIGFALGDIGMVRLHRNEFTSALEYFDQALEVHRGIDFPFGVSLWLAYKGDAILARHEGDDAPEPQHLHHACECAAECLSISRHISKADTEFRAQVLMARIKHAQGQQPAALEGLTQLLGETASIEHQADAQYWLWKLTEASADQDAGDSASISHREEALRLYEDLYRRAPVYEHRRRIAELRGG